MSFAAQAQDAPRVSEAPAVAGDIIVTATRRAQALSDVPIAVSALSADQLTNAGTTDIRSLNQLAPSLLVSGATSEASFTARIRGVGTVGENPGLESSVALFIDGVYRSRTGTGLSDLGEIERVEVLRGPQGTLFGRNASAGIINVTTKKPAFETAASAAVTYGNYDNIRVEGMVNGVIAEGFAAAKLEGLFHKRDGYMKDVVTGRDFNDRNRWMLRGQLLLEPSPDVTIRIIGDYAGRDEQCCAASVLDAGSLSRDADGNVITSPNTLLPILRALGSQIQPGELFKVAVSPSSSYSGDSTDWGLSGEINWSTGIGTLTSITAYRDYEYVQGQDGDFSNLDIWARTDFQRRFRTFSQELRMQGTLFEDRLDWLVGGYYSDEKLFLSDNIQFGADSERFGDCLVANALNAAFPGTLNPAVPRCTNLPASVWPGYANLAAALGAPRLPGTGSTGDGWFRHNSRNYAFFTHNVIDIIPDTLTLTLGARYTNERKTIESVFDSSNQLCTALRAIASTAAALPCAINSTGGPGFSKGDVGTRISEGKWTGTASLAWKPNEDVMVYGSWARGYKAGGFNLDGSALDPVCNPNAGTAAQQAACAAQLARPAYTSGNARPEATDLQFSAETVDAYEFGVKFSKPGFSANLALFKQDFNDFQLNTYNGVNFEVTNIQACRDDLGGADSDGSALTGACAPDRLKPGVSSKGVELELSASPIRNLSFTQGLTYTDTRFASNLVGTQGRPLAPTLFQLPGRRMSNAPEFVMSGSASWTPDLGDSGLKGLVYVDYRFQSDTNTGSDLDIEKIQDAYVIVNGRIGIAGPDRRWSVELWGQNLFNKQYFQIGADMPLQGSGTFRGVASGLQNNTNALFVTFPGEPRMFGITGRVRF
ncbi:TonB-dependent receptor [Sandaracinobacteroides sp. A072]|uniref:TonB-dependent receptor n=1 Tax=Sandaracinobacteroides sp. A072 TaxID=3461146 RepID=UPI0040414A5C